jgi:hypothetical protein
MASTSPINVLVPDLRGGDYKRLLTPLTPVLLPASSPTAACASPSAHARQRVVYSRFTVNKLTHIDTVLQCWTGEVDIESIIVLRDEPGELVEDPNAPYPAVSEEHVCLPAWSSLTPSALLGKRQFDIRDAAAAPQAVPWNERTSSRSKEDHATCYALVRLAKLRVSNLSEGEVEHWAQSIDPTERPDYAVWDRFRVTPRVTPLKGEPPTSPDAELTELNGGPPTSPNAANKRDRKSVV